MDSQGMLVAAWQAYDFLPSKPPSSEHVLNSAEAEETFLLLTLWTCPRPIFQTPVLS